MHVKVNRDEPDFSVSRSWRPTILKREVETSSSADGHTAVIGGIYTRQLDPQREPGPLLGDIRFSASFQKRSSQDNRTELVVFITPRIVNRAESLGR